MCFGLGVSNLKKLIMWLLSFLSCKVSVIAGFILKTSLTADELNE